MTIDDAHDLCTDEARLLDALSRTGLAETAHSLSHEVGIDPDHAGRLLARMADDHNAGPPYLIFRRVDLGRDVYDACDDSRDPEQMTW